MRWGPRVIWGAGLVDERLGLVFLAGPQGRHRGLVQKAQDCVPLCSGLGDPPRVRERDAMSGLLSSAENKVLTEMVPLVTPHSCLESKRFRGQTKPR